ncbi:MAG TPA: hypothetical protein VK844_05365 [Hyphomicrobiales bacterium]|nr:hypothetical protein [Hyphomicrobiales bacterium]
MSETDTTARDNTATVRRHAKRANAVAGARPARDFATAEPSQRVVPGSLDPRSFAHRTGLTNADRDRDPALAAAFGAAVSMHSGLEGIYARERAILADSSQTPANHTRLVARMVEKQSAEPLRANETAHKTVRNALAAIEDELQKAFKSRLPREDSAEIRQVLRSMGKKARNDYLAEAKKSGDFDAIAAVLAQKPIASGLAATEAARWRREFEIAHHAPLIARREKLEKALAGEVLSLLENLGGVHPR